MIHYVYLLNFNYYVMRLFFLLFIFISPFIYSQNELGLPLNEIKNRFKESKYELKQIVQNDGSISLSVKLEDAYATYYFDNDSYQLSNSLVITPSNQVALGKYVKFYNSKYKRAKSTIVKWLVETKLSEEISITETIHLSKISAKGEDDFYGLIWTFEK